MEFNSFPEIRMKVERLVSHSLILSYIVYISFDEIYGKQIFLDHEMKAWVDFVNENEIEYETKHVYPKEDIPLTEEQGEFVINSAKEGMDSFQIAISDWAAFSPQRMQREQWLSWAEGGENSEQAGNKPELPWVNAMLRRRLSPMGHIC